MGNRLTVDGDGQKPSKRAFVLVSSVLFLWLLVSWWVIDLMSMVVGRNPWNGHSRSFRVCWWWLIHLPAWVCVTVSFATVTRLNNKTEIKLKTQTFLEVGTTAHPHLHTRRSVFCRGLVWKSDAELRTQQHFQVQWSHDWTWKCSKSELQSLFFHHHHPPPPSTNRKGRGKFVTGYTGEGGGWVTISEAE